MMKNMNSFEVCVRCLTFNHADYIGETLNGFTIQKTSFPFVCCIVDDASTDGEQEIIVNYLHDHFDLDNSLTTRKEETDDYVYIYAKHKQNKNCFFAVFLLKYNHYRNTELKNRKLQYIAPWNENAKYISVCEGDDYWIHPNKLQMQYEYMESNPNCGLIRTNINVFHQEENRIENEYYSHGFRLKQVDTMDFYIMVGWFAAPCTWFTRNGIQRNSIVSANQKCMKGDILYILSVFDAGYSVHYIPIVTAVYRELSNSASHFTDPSKRYLFYEKNKRTRLHFARKKDWKFKMRFLWRNAIVSRPLTFRAMTIAPLWFYDSFVRDVYYIFRKRDF